MIRDNKNYQIVPKEILEGVDTELITPEFESLVEELICPICQCLVIKPVMCKTCEKPFCKHCITQWLKKKNTCPNRCKYKEGELTRILKNLLNKVKLKCPNNELGCGETIIFENFEKHINSCDYSEWKCLGSGCNFKGIKQAVIDHTNNGCSSLLEKCKHCKRMFKINKLMKHFNNCDKMVEICIYCGMKITKESIKKHTVEYCAGTVTKNYERMMKELQEENSRMKAELRVSGGIRRGNSSNSSTEIRNRNTVVFENFISAGICTFNNIVAGTNKVDDLNDSSMNKGKIKEKVLISSVSVLYQFTLTEIL